LAEKQEIVHETDQIAENDRAEPAHDADDKGQYREQREPDASDLVVDRGGREIRATVSAGIGTGLNHYRVGNRAVRVFCRHWSLSAVQPGASAVLSSR
jgi:hypothetical protein